jgi:FkbM family methyltransferase
MMGPYASYNNETGYATWDPGVTYVGTFERHKVVPKGIIHVGLWDFVEHQCYTKLVGSNVIGIEANPQTFESKSKPVADRWGYRAYSFAAYDTDDETVELSLKGGTSSLFGGKEASCVKVKTKRLDTFVIEESIDMIQYDFLNIDTEGAELHVLHGFEENMHHINSAFIEASIEPRGGSQTTVKDISGYMLRHGLIEVERSKSFAQLGWGDIFFVRQS